MSDFKGWRRAHGVPGKSLLSYERSDGTASVQQKRDARGEAYFVFRVRGRARGSTDSLKVAIDACDLIVGVSEP